MSDIAKRLRDTSLIWPAADVWVLRVEAAEEIERLEAALRALYLQALQSNVNAPANEWGREALEHARTALEWK